MTKQEAQSKESMTAVEDEGFRWLVQKIEICSTQNVLPQFDKSLHTVTVF